MESLKQRMVSVCVCTSTDARPARRGGVRDFRLVSVAPEGACHLPATRLDTQTAATRLGLPPLSVCHALERWSSDVYFLEINFDKCYRILLEPVTVQICHFIYSTLTKHKGYKVYTDFTAHLTRSFPCICFMSDNFRFQGFANKPVQYFHEISFIAKFCILTS